MAIKLKTFSKFEEDMRIIQNLGNNPNSDDGLSSEELKRKFDSAGIKIKDYLLSTIEQLNQVITELNKQFEGSGDVLSGGTMLGALNMNGHTISGVPDPSEASHAVNRKYADKIVGETQKIAESKCSASAKTVSLAAEGWSDKNQTVTVTGVIADSDKCHVIVSPAEVSREAYNDAVVRCTAQGDGTLTFACDDIPETELTVCVLILV